MTTCAAIATVIWSQEKFKNMLDPLNETTNASTYRFEKRIVECENIRADNFDGLLENVQ